MLVDDICIPPAFVVLLVKAHLTNENALLSNPSNKYGLGPSKLQFVKFIVLEPREMTLFLELFPYTSQCCMLATIVRPVLHSKQLPVPFAICSWVLNKAVRTKVALLLSKYTKLPLELLHSLQNDICKYPVLEPVN